MSRLTVPHVSGAQISYSFSFDVIIPARSVGLLVKEEVMEETVTTHEASYQVTRQPDCGVGQSGWTMFSARTSSPKLRPVNRREVPGSSHPVHGYLLQQPLK